MHRRNHPSRISLAVPGHPSWSVFTGMVLKAVRTWRVSSSPTAKPRLVYGCMDHCDSGPASRPIRSIGAPCWENQSISASATLSAFPSRRILP